MADREAPTFGAVYCPDYKAGVEHPTHWHVIRAGGITFAQGQCPGLKTSVTPTAPDAPRPANCGCGHETCPGVWSGACPSPARPAANECNCAGYLVGSHAHEAHCAIYAPRPAANVTDVLAAHRWAGRGPFGDCECGWQRDWKSSVPDAAQYRAHVAAILEAGPVAEAERRGAQAVLTAVEAEIRDSRLSAYPLRIDRIAARARAAAEQTGSDQ